MADEHKTDLDPALTEVDALLRAARAAPPVVSDDLMAAILADASQMQAGFLPPEVPARRQSFFAALLSVLGGGIGVGGLVTAGLAGVWIGVAPPAFLPDPMELTGITSTSELFDGFDMSELISEDLQ